MWGEEEGLDPANQGLEITARDTYLPLPGERFFLHIGSDIKAFIN
jgi:hypothetical protein